MKRSGRINPVSAKKLAANPRAKFSTFSAKPKAIRARNPKRQDANFERAYHSVARVEWINGLPCIVASCPIRPSVNAHTKGGGVARKAGYETIVPACDPHHREMHRGIRSFAAKYAIDLAQEAAKVQAAWVALETRGFAA